jgi:glycosyltransferase involved in cell wall biosynthesis
MKPFVTHVVESLEVGGAERLVCDLSMARGSDSTSVVCLRQAGALGETLRAAGITVDEVGLTGTSWRAVRRLAGLLRERKADIVHCHDLLAHRYGSVAVVAAGDRPRTVVTVHLTPPPMDNVRRAINRRLLRRSEVAAVSEDVRDSLQQWIGRPVRYIPNGIALAPYINLPARQEARANLPAPYDAFLIGIVARLQARKGHLQLLNALVSLRCDVPNAMLIIAGDGPMREAIQSAVRTLGLDACVILLGERRDIPQVLAALDVFCLPSDDEGMPLAMLEAMATGLPVVATAVGAIPSAVYDGESGLLIPRGDSAALAQALLTIASNPAVAAAMGRAARKRVEAQFHLPVVLANYEELYGAALSQRS